MQPEPAESCSLVTIGDNFTWSESGHLQIAVHVFQETLESFATVINAEPRKSGMALRGDGRQHPRRIPGRCSIHQVLDVRVKVSVDG
jgi:hypothetical protein